MSVRSQAPSTELELMERLTEPTDDAIAAARELDGDILILGAGGKIGPSFALFVQRCLARAGSPYRLTCVSRFSDASTAMMLGRAGIRIIGADLQDPRELERLPDAPNVFYLVGQKFGTTDAPSRTWAVNVLLPFAVGERFPKSRIVALSSGNVYPFVAPTSGGATEDTPPDPVGEYAQTCLGRERVLEHVSERHGTPILLVRLNYACDLRYGVPVDIGRKVRDGQPIDVTMGYFNVVWQGDLSRVLFRSLPLCSSPPAVLNVTGPDIVRVRDAAHVMAEVMSVPTPQMTGVEAPTALLSNASRCWSMFGPPTVSTDTLLAWTAHWLSIGGRLLDKPTHFETRDGRF